MARRDQVTPGSHRTMTILLLRRAIIIWIKIVEKYWTQRALLYDTSEINVLVILSVHGPASGTGSLD